MQLHNIRILHNFLFNSQKIEMQRQSSDANVLKIQTDMLSLVDLESYIRLDYAPMALSYNQRFFIKR